MRSLRRKVRPGGHPVMPPVAIITWEAVLPGFSRFNAAARSKHLRVDPGAWPAGPSSGSGPSPIPVGMQLALLEAPNRAGHDPAGVSCDNLSVLHPVAGGSDPAARHPDAAAGAHQISAAPAPTGRFRVQPKAM